MPAEARTIPRAPAPAAPPAGPGARTRPPPAGPHGEAARALVEAGLLAEPNEGAAASLLQKHARPGQYHFAADAEFLHQSISHHLGAYFKQVMEPMARAHHSKAMQGRLYKDEDIEKATAEIIMLVAAETGAGYGEHLERYFGDREKMVAYMYSRVRNLLMEEAIKANDGFLSSIHRREAMAAVASAQAGKGAAPG